jgi:hypothetical protein
MKLKTPYIIFLFFLFISIPFTVSGQISIVFQANVDGTVPPGPPVPPGDTCTQYCNIDSTTNVAQIRDITGDALHTITSAGITVSGNKRWRIKEFQSCTDILIFDITFDTNLAICTINNLNIRHDSDSTGIYLVGGAICSGKSSYILNKLDYNLGTIIWAISDNINNFTPTTENGVTGTIIDLQSKSIVVGDDGVYVGGSYEEQYFLSVVKQRSFLKKFSKIDGSLIWSKQILQDQANEYESAEDLAYNIDTVFVQLDTAGNITSMLPRNNYVQSINESGVIRNWSTLTETIGTRLPRRIRSDNTNIYSAYRNILANNSIIYKLDRNTGVIITNTGLITTKSISDMNLDIDNVYFTWYYGVDKIAKSSFNVITTIWSTGTTCASFALFINGKVMIQSIRPNNNWVLENRLLSNGTGTCTISTISCPGGIPPFVIPQSNYFYGAQNVTGSYLGYGQADQSTLDSTAIEIDPFP